MATNSDIAYIYYDSSSALMSISYVGQKVKELCGTQERKYFNTDASIIPVSDEQLASSDADKIVKYANEKTEEKVYEILNDLRRMRNFCFFGSSYVFNLASIQNIQRSNDKSTAYISIIGFKRPLEFDLRFEDGDEEYVKLYNAKLRYEQNKMNNQKRYARINKKQKHCDEQMTL